MEDANIEQKQRWARQQDALAAQVDIPQSGGYTPQRGDILLGLDIQYEGDTAYVAGDLSQWQGDHIGTYAGTFAVTAPYISGYFCFREGPPVLALLAAINALSPDVPAPQVLLVDGHGIAHPRRFGAACWIGVATGLPALGCAKDTLLRFQGELPPAKGSHIPVWLPPDAASTPQATSTNGAEEVGAVLRRIEEVRPVYVSPGHQLSLQTARQMVLDLPSRYRIPDPIRRADRAARALSKGTFDDAKDKRWPGEWRALGDLPPTPAPWDEG